MQSDLIVIPSLGPLSTRSHWSRYSAPAAEGGASGMHSDNSDRILIVEDDLLVASEMEAALTDAGFQIAGTASTGKEALELAQAQSPTLVVMDIQSLRSVAACNATLTLSYFNALKREIKLVRPVNPLHEICNSHPNHGDASVWLINRHRRAGLPW